MLPGIKDFPSVLNYKSDTDQGIAVKAFAWKVNKRIRDQWDYDDVFTDTEKQGMLWKALLFLDVTQYAQFLSSVKVDVTSVNIDAAVDAFLNGDVGSRDLCDTICQAYAAHGLTPSGEQIGDVLAIIALVEEQYCRTFFEKPDLRVVVEVIAEMGLNFACLIASLPTLVANAYTKMHS